MLQNCSSEPSGIRNCREEVVPTSGRRLDRWIWVVHQETANLCLPGEDRKLWGVCCESGRRCQPRCRGGRAGVVRWWLWPVGRRHIGGRLRPRLLPDPKTVVALRQEPMLTQTPPGASLAAVTETVSCGWEGSGSPTSECSTARSLEPVPLMRCRASTQTSPAPATGRHLARAVMSTTLRSRTDQLHVEPPGNQQARDLRVQITYTPRNLRPTCL